MKSFSVTEFKAHCLELLKDLERTGESLILTRHGKPTAMVVLPPADAARKWTLGLHRESARVVGDIVAPIAEPWEALQ